MAHRALVRARHTHGNCGRKMTALRPIEVRGAATADDVPKVWRRPWRTQSSTTRCSRSLGRGVGGGRRGCERCLTVEIEQYVLANGGTVWTTSGYDGAVAELPPDAWEMPKSMTLDGGAQMDVGVRDAVSPARSASSARWSGNTSVSPTSTCERSACAPLCRGRAWDRR